VYLKVKGIILNYDKTKTANDYAYRFNDDFFGATGTNGMAYANNYYVTKVLNSYSDAQGTNEIGTYYIPLVKATKAMKAGHLYNLTFDLSKAVTLEGGEGVFDGATIE